MASASFCCTCFPTAGSIVPGQGSTLMPKDRGSFETFGVHRSGGSRAASSVVTCHGIYIMTHIFILTSVIRKVKMRLTHHPQFPPQFQDGQDLEVLKPWNISDLKESTPMHPHCTNQVQASPFTEHYITI